jgi:hypothetical protein
MKLRRHVLGALVGSSLLVGQTLAPPAVQAGHPDRPTRIVVIILDQARPDTIERYEMRNVQALMEEGVNFPKAILGHMAAETVVSDNVITSGQFPNNQGWSNEVHRDAAGVLGTPGDYYVTSSMSCGQFKALIDAAGHKKLADYLDDHFGESSRFVSIAQKRTAAWRPLKGSERAAAAGLSRLFGASGNPQSIRDVKSGAHPRHVPIRRAVILSPVPDRTWSARWA